jgi:hypothetical protein
VVTDNALKIDKAFGISERRAAKREIAMQQMKLQNEIAMRKLDRAHEAAMVRLEAQKEWGARLAPALTSQLSFASTGGSVPLADPGGGGGSLALILILGLFLMANKS